MIECTPYYFEDDGSIPNNPDLSLLHYPEAFSSNGLDALMIKDRFINNGWTGAWVDGIYSYHHYHSTAHEVLGCSRGSADVRFGGEQGEMLTLEAGDVVIIPAGVGHCRLSSSSGFQVVGAYPDGQSWDLCTGKTSERPEVLENIRNVPLPGKDPVTGNEDPLLSYWTES